MAFDLDADGDIAEDEQAVSFDRLPDGPRTGAIVAEENVVGVDGHVITAMLSAAGEGDVGCTATRSGRPAISRTTPHATMVNGGNGSHEEEERGREKDRLHRVRDGGRRAAQPFTGQRVNASTPFEFVDLSVKEKYETQWKERVRTRIRRSNGVIALISSSTARATRQLWEISCAVQEGKPLLGIWLGEHRVAPVEMRGAPCKAWT